MKKTIVSILCILFVLICFSCKHSSSTTEDPAEEDNSSVTARELIKNLPITFSQFQNQTNSSRTATEISCEDCDPINSWDYSRITDDEESMSVYFLTILKNDIAPVIEIPFDTTIDVSSINSFSQETVNLFSKIEQNPNEWISNLGKLKVSYESEKIEIFWELSTVGYKGVIYTTPLYIAGTYKDGKYILVTTYCLSDNHPYIESFIKTENGYVDNIISFNEDKSMPVKSKTILDNSSRKFFSYGNGEIIQLGYLGASTACYWSNSWGSPNDKYIVFDEHGYLVFVEDYNSSSTNYSQYIPLNFLQCSKVIIPNGNFYYLESVDEENKTSIENKLFTVFDLNGAESASVNFLCLKRTSSEKTTIELPTDFTFPKKDYTISSINKIEELRTESQTAAIKNDFLTDAEVQAIETKVNTWCQGL